MPEPCERGTDRQLLTERYSRSDIAAPHAGEHSIEHEILNNLKDVRCLGGTVVDGINAMPISRDDGGTARRGNVEADLFLLVENAGSYQLVICAASTPTGSSANSWQKRSRGAPRRLGSGLPGDLPPRRRPLEVFVASACSIDIRVGPRRYNCRRAIK